MKWSVSLLASCFELTVLDIGVELFIFLIYRQICIDLISASLLHHIAHFYFFTQKSFLLVSCWQRRSFSLFLLVILALKSLVSWLTCLVHFLDVERIEEIGWS